MKSVMKTTAFSLVLLLFVSACSHKGDSVTGNTPQLLIALSDIVGGGGLVTKLNRAKLVDTNMTAAVWIRLSDKAAHDLEIFSREHLNQRVQFQLGTNVVGETMYSVITNKELDLFFPSTDEAIAVQRAVADALPKNRTATENTVTNKATPLVSPQKQLAQLGLAFRVWAAGHNGQYPFNVSQSQGGTLELCNRDKEGFEMNPVPVFIVMSNEVFSTTLLICPNDKTKQAAPDFASSTTNNISYRLRTGSNVSQDHPQEVLAVDPLNGWKLYCDGSVGH